MSVRMLSFNLHAISSREVPHEEVEPVPQYLDLPTILLALCKGKVQMNMPSFKGQEPRSVCPYAPFMNIMESCEVRRGANGREMRAMQSILSPKRRATHSARQSI